MYDIIIIGGGITGCAIAYHLARAGEKVLVLEENFICSGATGRCGGGMRQQFTSDDQIVLARDSIKIFENFAEEVELDEVDIEFEQGGYLILAHSEVELEEFKRWAKLHNSLGVPSRILNKEGIREIVPEIEFGDVTGASFCPTDGKANPFKVTGYYYDAARENRADFKKYARVERIEMGEEDKFTVKTADGDFTSEKLIIAAGFNSKELAAHLGVELPLKPYKHEILATEPLKHFLDPMVMSFSHNFYFSQTVHGEIIGGWSDLYAKPENSIDASLGFLKRMSSFMSRYFPCLREVSVLRQWGGLYDVTPDSRPIVGGTQIPGLFIACGYSGHGFMLAPEISKQIAEIVLDERSEAEELSLSRFEGGFEGGEIRRERGVVG